MRCRAPHIRVACATLCLAFALTAFAVRAYSATGSDRARLLVEEARAAARDDRHEDAIAGYLRALREHEWLREDVSKELGLQYTWAGHPDSAVHWFETHLRYHPDDTEARIGLARALSHADRLDEARASYDDILAEDPGNLQARIGRAYVINWSGRHREAARIFQRILEHNPDNSAVRAGLAQAYQWIGRDDLARRTVSPTDADRGLGHIAEEIRRSRMPGAEYTYSSNEDSDDIERRGHSVSFSASPWLLARSRVSYSNQTITQPDHNDVDRDAVAFELHQRFSNSLALTLVPGYEWNVYDRFGPEPFWLDSFELFTWDAYLTVTPRDWVRLDFGADRGTLDNPEPLYRGIRLDTYGAGLDWRFTSRLLSVSAVSYSSYSDGNRRVLMRQTLTWSTPFRMPIPGLHRITSTSGAGYISFSKQLANGYYNPDDYLTLYQILALELTPAHWYTLRFEGRLGLDSENGGPLFNAGAISGSMTVRPTAGLSVTAGYYNTRSRLDTREGYEADGFYISTGYKFGH